MFQIAFQHTAFQNNVVFPISSYVPKTIEA